MAMRKGRILIRQEDRILDGWRCNMCSWLALAPFLTLIFEPIPREIQDAFKSHYCSKHPYTDPIGENISPTAEWI